MSAMLLTGHLTTYAQEQVEMTTATGIGETFSFAVNPGAVITVDWGDGVPVSMTATDSPLTGVLKGATVTVAGDKITMLNCNSAQLTALNVSSAPSLSTLYCADNQLTELSLTSNTAITDLDCSANQLTTLLITRLKNLLTLDCSDNQITTLSVRNSTGLKHLMCGNNKLTTLSLTALSNLETLWCPNNELTTLTIDNNKKLESLVCDGNQLTRIKTATAGHPSIVDFWCADNQLTTLALNGSSQLKTLNCENNLLTSTTLAPLTEPALAIYMGNNMLDFRYFYNGKNVKNIFYDPQAQFALSAEKVNIDEEVECPDMRKDGEGLTVAPTYAWINEADNSTLARGSSKDYVAVSSKSWAFRFKKPFEAVHCLVTSPNFPGVTLQSTTVQVIDPTTDGITETMKNSGFTYGASDGTLYMSSEQAVPVRIYTLGGKLVWSGTVSGSGTRVHLGRGVFLVNHIKVAL